MKCSFIGCKNEAHYKITQSVGKKQVTLICEEHAPQWVREETLTPFYTIENLQKTVLSSEWLIQIGKGMTDDDYGQLVVDSRRRAMERGKARADLSNTALPELLEAIK